MTMRTVPEKVVWVCDCCKTEQESKPRPKHWSEFVLKRDAYDMHGCACADATVCLVFCSTCSGRLADFVNSRLPARAEVDIVFDALPGPESPRFIEVENMQGASIKLGEWIKRDDGYAVLRIKAELPAPPGGQVDG